MTSLPIESDPAGGRTPSGQPKASARRFSKPASSGSLAPSLSVSVLVMTRPTECPALAEPGPGARSVAGVRRRTSPAAAFRWSVDGFGEPTSGHRAALACWKWEGSWLTFFLTGRRRRGCGLIGLGRQIGRWRVDGWQNGHRRCIERRSGDGVGAAGPSTVGGHRGNM